MKKLLKFLFLLLAGVVIVNSCREDGEWEDNNNTGIYGFTVDRDTDFIEKSVGETNQLKFNIKTKYDFSTIPMKLKYTTNLDGVLILDGKELEQNKEYIISKADNVLEYVGNETGTHELKISVKNDKEASLVEEFSFPYSVSEFSVVTPTNNKTITQGVLSNYIVKIEPQGNTPKSDFEIRIDNFDNHAKSKIFLGSTEITVGKFYSLNEDMLHNIELGAIIGNSGASKISFTVKNKTVTKTNNEIHLQVQPREVIVVSLAPSETTLPKNKSFSISAIVNKQPVKENQELYYKTWISSNSPNGVTNTNNQWTPYTLGADNRVLIPNLLTNEFGTHTYNIQFKDEYGNESEVKSFDIKVAEELSFTQAPSGTLTIVREVEKSKSGLFDATYFKIHHINSSLNFSVKTGLNNKITKYKLDITYDFLNSNKALSYTEVLDVPLEELTVSKLWEKNEKIFEKLIFGYRPNDEKHYATNAKYVLIVYDSAGNTITQKGNLNLNHIGY